MIRKFTLIALILLFILSCESERTTEPAAQGNSPLGNTVHVSLSVKALPVSLEFFGKLGFRKLDSRESGENPWALISDGKMLIMLSQNPFPSPGLTYYAPDMQKRVARVEQSGFKFDDILSAGGRFSSAVARSPGGISVSLIAFDDQALPGITEPFETKCGNFKELSIPTKDVSTSKQFWWNLGFEVTTQDSMTGHEMVLSDGLIHLNLWQNAPFLSPALTYSTADLKRNLQTLRQTGVPVSKQLPVAPGEAAELQIVTPDQHLIRIVEE